MLIGRKKVCLHRLSLTAGSRRSSGRALNIVGPATANARRPNVLRRCRGPVNEYQLRLGRLIPIADERVGVQVKLWNPLRTRTIPEHFCGGDSLRRGAISSVRTFIFLYLYTHTPCLSKQCCWKLARTSSNLNQFQKFFPHWKAGPKMAVFSGIRGLNVKF